MPYLPFKNFFTGASNLTKRAALISVSQLYFFPFSASKPFSWISVIQISLSTEVSIWNVSGKPSIDDPRITLLIQQTLPRSTKRFSITPALF